MTTLDYRNNTYQVEIDGEVVDVYIPSPEEVAMTELRERNKSFLETHRELAQGQRMDRLENEHYKWGESKKQ